MRRAVWVGSAILVVLAAAVFLLRHRMLITVRPGEVLIVYHRFGGGTASNSLGREGLNVILPWDTPYRYAIRAQTVVLPMTVLTRDGLEVKLDAQIRFRVYPRMAPYLHRRYGPDYVEKVIVPELTETIQGLAGQFHAEDYYSFQREAARGRMFQTAQRLIGGVYVYVEDISMLNVRLPDRVQSAIQVKAEAEQDARKQAFLVNREVEESERKRVEAEGQGHYGLIRIPRDVLQLKGIEAITDLSRSPNSKVVVR